MPFTGIIAAGELDGNSCFRLRVANWEKYQSKNVHEFIKVLPANPMDTLRHENLSVRGLFFEILRYAAVSRRTGWLIDGDNQPITLAIIGDILHLGEKDKRNLLENLCRLIISERITLYSSEISTDLQTLEKPSETLSNLAEVSQDRIEKSRVDENRVDEDVPAQGSLDAATAKLQKCKVALDRIEKNRKDLFPFVEFPEQWRKIQVYQQKCPKEFAQKKDFNKFCLKWLNRAQEQAAYRKEQQDAKRTGGQWDKLAIRGSGSDQYGKGDK